MKNQSQPFETRGHDHSGNASLEFHDNETIQSFASLIPGMDISRFKPVALKIFLSVEIPMITLYALDKDTVNKSNVPEDKQPVRKFKAPISMPELFRFIKHFDVIVYDGEFNLENMWVENK